jgi:small GTP-binding protein
MDDPESSYKIVLAGNSGVGKTCLFLRFVDNTFDPDPPLTVGVAYRPFTITVEEERIKLNIWDTAGQERFRYITQTYFRCAIGAILVFAIDDVSSFEDLHQWMFDLHSYASPNAVILLVGNKADHFNVRTVSASEVDAFARRHSLLYLETSALDGQNVSEAFHRLAREIQASVKKGKIAGDFQVPRAPEIPTPEDSCHC